MVYYGTAVVWCFDFCCGLCFGLAVFCGIVCVLRWVWFDVEWLVGMLCGQLFTGVCLGFLGVRFVVGRLVYVGAYVCVLWYCAWSGLLGGLLLLINAGLSALFASWVCYWLLSIDC